MKISDYTLKAQLGPPSNPQRTVKARKKYTVESRIAVCDATMNVWFEDRTDMSCDWDLISFVKYARDHWPLNSSGNRDTTPILLICHNPHKVFDCVHRVFKNDPQWQARFTVSTTERFYVDGKVRAPKVRNVKDIRISLFGFRDSNRKTRYFHIICPLDYMDDFKEYGDPNWPEYIRLYHWGGSVRKWVRKHNLRFSPTRGGIAAQLLKDERFYGEARRKVPKQTNENARKALPGNFYAMREQSVGRMYSSVYLIDQQNAHHYAAETVALPDANTLFARGRFALQADKAYAREDRDTFNNLFAEHGLYRCCVWVPKGLFGMLPPWAQNAGIQYVYLFSNEIELAKSLGIEIRYVSHAWTSPNTDTGLHKYAQWAQRQVKEHPDSKVWMKPTLLSAYGILGARPRHIEVAHFRSDKGEDYRYLLGPTPIVMKKMRTKREVQPAIANVIHRGMIEAETRKLSIELARKLEQENHTVIAIHADGILVHDEGQQLPLLSPPWRVKDRLSGFQAIDNVSYESDTVCVLPGRKKTSSHSKKKKTHA